MITFLPRASAVASALGCALPARWAGEHPEERRVAIPPYRSGSSKEAVAAVLLPEPRSVAIPPYRSGKFQDRRALPLPQRDPRPVAIPPYRSGQFQVFLPRKEPHHGYDRRNPTVQIREAPRFSIRPWPPPKQSRSRNPTVQIREVPTHPLAPVGRRRTAVVAIPP